MARPRKKVIAMLKLLQREGRGHLTIDEALAGEEQASARQRGRPKGSVKWTDERRLALWEPYHRLRAKGLSIMEASRELSRSLEFGNKAVAKRIKEARGLGPGMLEATLEPMTLAAEGKVTGKRRLRRKRSK